MIRYSFFHNTESNEPVMFDAPDWISFVETMAEFFCDERPATQEEKCRNTPMISPATYLPDATRKNTNVQSFGGWFALDVDKGQITTAQFAEIMEAVPSDYVIWTTTKSVPGAERFRAAFPLSREVPIEDARQLWAGAHAFFGEIGDVQTKDPSRILAVPAQWEGSEPIFLYRAEGDCMDVNDLLSYAPPEVPPEPVRVTMSELKKVQAALAGKGKDVPLYQGLYDSKAVHTSFVDAYLNLPKGDHHAGLYRFMCCVADRALFMGLNITTDHLVEYAKQVDRLCSVRTNPQRWRRIHQEAQTALNWANQQYSMKAFIIKQ